MFRKRISKILILKNKPRPQALACFFILISLSFSVFTFAGEPVTRFAKTEEFVKQLKQEKKRKFLLLKDEWTSFLTENQAQLPENKNIHAAKEATLDFLISSGRKKAKFAKEIQKIEIYPMTFTRPPDEEGSDRGAAFDRGKRSIFIDLKEFTKTEWLKAFIHEGAHRLDDQLYNAIPIFSEEKFNKFLSDKGQQNIQLSDLTPIQRKKLDAWLVAGLDRGFFGEYRAWLLTYVLYKEARKDGMIEADEWLEELYVNQPKSTPDDIYIFRNLDSSWVDPTIGLFSYAFIQEALKELRAKYSQNPRLIKLGQIGEILK